MLMNQFQSYASTKTSANRHDDRAKGFNRPPLLADHFSNIVRWHFHFDNSSLLAIKNLHFDSIRLIDEIFNQIRNEFFHLIDGTSNPGLLTKEDVPLLFNLLKNGAFYNGLWQTLFLSICHSVFLSVHFCPTFQREFLDQNQASNEGRQKHCDRSFFRASVTPQKIVASACRNLTLRKNLSLYRNFELSFSVWLCLSPCASWDEDCSLDSTCFVSFTKKLKDKALYIK